MDERWMKALRAKGIVVGDPAVKNGTRLRSERNAAADPSGKASRQSQSISVPRAKPFKATGHKGGISRQGN
ncbi:hypothetical protein [Bifidobacterium aerophilum]|uniref:Uncharacterized protein n=1 Tax=Bifidobacterium aerophilum TaxID=1798155 RepID=A0A6N9Z8T1_9BIFI|nr:hypothetical protein [Bifidobacterium aerophilum]NEG90503.1 hypothetical protein [Bifidobacterium aerophilum]